MPYICATDYASAHFMSVYHAIHPSDFKGLNTQRIREAFLLSPIFSDDAVTHYYTHYDRLIAGGIKPVINQVSLEPISQLKAEFFLERREMGIINVGDPGIVSADGKEFFLKNKEALYIGAGTRVVSFHPAHKGQTLFYYNSTPAHRTYPTRVVTQADSETADAGAAETSNLRTIRKLIVASVLPTCQLQMGLTELKSGSVWNTMPPHTHDRRMEVYFYFDLQGKNRVCHFLGEPEETRHIWVNNHEAVLSPPWSIHCGAGTGQYSFVWGMAGENMDYTDMDPLQITDLR